MEEQGDKAKAHGAECQMQARITSMTRMLRLRL